MASQRRTKTAAKAAAARGRQAGSLVIQEVPRSVAVDGVTYLGCEPPRARPSLPSGTYWIDRFFS